MDNRRVMFFFGGTGLAIITGALLYLGHVLMSDRFLLLTALLIVAVTFAVWRFPVRVRPVTPNPERKPDDGQPIVGTRRWARMLYHNGLISIEELSSFYDQTPEEPEDHT